MYNLYLNRLIDDEEHSKEFLQELRNDNQLVKFIWEDSSYPFDKLEIAAKEAYEENRIEDRYIRVASVKRHWECPWEIMQHSENEFKLLLGMKGYWRKWVVEAIKDLFPLFLVETVAMLLIGAIVGGMTLLDDSTRHMFWEFTIGIFKFLEKYLIVFILLQILHPAFDETIALIYSIVLATAYILVEDKAIVFISFAIIYTIHTKNEEKKLVEYQPYIGFYYKE